MSDPLFTIERNCPHVWKLLNQKAKRELPKGMEDFVSDRWGKEGQSQLQLADSRISYLMEKTSAACVGDAYRRDFSGVCTEKKLAELLCEITLVAALGGISDSELVLRPETRAGKQSDVKVVIDGGDLYGEIKRFADTWEGGVRSIAKSPPESKPANAFRPRAMDVFSKLKDVYTQFPQGTLNVLFLFHPSVWNSPVYIKQALFGDAVGFDESDEPRLHDDGLFALSEWREIAACAHLRVNSDGSVSVAHIWRNPKANVSLADRVRERLFAAI